MTDLTRLCWRALAAAVLAAAAGHAAAQTGDYIIAVVNQDLVTASEVQQRLARVRDEAARNHTPLPPAPTLRRQVLDALIDERVLVTNARDSGLRIEDPELDRAVTNVAQQNQLSLAQLRERLRQEGIPFAKFRDIDLRRLAGGSAALVDEVVDLGVADLDPAHDLALA